MAITKKIILCVLLLFVTSNSQAALTFVDNDGSDEIVFTTGILNDAATIAVWVKLADVGNTFRCMFAEGNDGAGLGIIANNVGDGTIIQIFCTGTGTNAVAMSVTGTLVAGEWAFIAATYNIGVSVNIYKGNLTTSIVDVGNGAEDAGTGNHSFAAEAFTIGALSDIVSNGMDVAFCTIYNKVLTLGQLKQIQYSLKIVDSGCLLHVFPGYQGNANGVNCTDYSGNATNGTLAGSLALANHVPLGPPFGAEIPVFLIACLLWISRGKN